MRYGALVPLLCAAGFVAGCGDPPGSRPEPMSEAASTSAPDAASTPAPEPPPAVTPIPAPEPSPTPRADERERMVAWQIEGRGIRDPLVLAAMRRVPRHLFVPAWLESMAYHDRPLAIGWDQTISQPYIVASMTEEARITPDSRVLEIGTGSGYQAAVLGAVTARVFSIEIKKPLARKARQNLDAAGFSSVKTKHGDGYYGWEEHAPFDAILVTAAAPHVPPPLVEQLAPGGRMVIPVGAAMSVQDLLLVTKDEAGKVRTKSLYPVRFVPLTGRGAGP